MTVNDIHVATAILFIYLFILLLCKPHVEYKNTDNDWNHIRPASLDLNCLIKSRHLGVHSKFL